MGGIRRFGPGAPLPQLWYGVGPMFVLKRQWLCRRPIGTFRAPSAPRNTFALGSFRENNEQ
jgi:hypothetical protein